MEPKPLSVIDVLTRGFELVRKRPWAMLIPILVDLVIWFLPRVSLANLIAPIMDQLLATANAPADAADAIQQQRELLTQAINSLNFFGLVAYAANWVARLPSLFTPSLVLDGSSIDVRSPITALAYTIQVPSVGFAVLLFVPLLMLLLFAAAVYAELLAQGVRPLVEEPRFAWVGRAAMLWLRLLGFALLLGFIFFATSLALGAIQMVAPATTDIGSFFYALVLVGWFWLSIYFFFALSAMAVSRIGLYAAIRRSVLVFRMHFWASLLLIGLTVFLGEGLALLWRGLAITPFGAALGILANAFIGTALLAAAMIFYQDRMSAIERLIAHARASTRPTR